MASAKVGRVKQALVHLRLAMQALEGQPEFAAVAPDARALYEKLQRAAKGV
jgi:hypothetical protein